MSSDFDWPPISDEALLAIWRAPDDALFGMIPGFLRRLGERVPQAMAPGYEAPYSYPFGPARSVTWIDGDEARTPSPEEAVAARVGRIPVLAIGANGSASRLALKLAALDERAALLTPAALEGADICALPFPAGYGSFPAGIAASPGTTVRTVVVELTPTQLEWLAVTEFGYLLARLTGTVARLDDGRELTAPFAFVQRGGLYDVGGGAPAPLAAIPATGRRWRAWEQRELFAHLAARLGDPDPDPDALREVIDADAGAWMATHATALLRAATTAHEPPAEPHPEVAARPTGPR